MNDISDARRYWDLRIKGWDNLTAEEQCWLHEFWQVKMENPAVFAASWARQIVDLQLAKISHANL